MNIRRTSTRRTLLAGAGALAAGVTAACAVPFLGGGSAGVPLAQRKAARIEFWGGPNAEQRKAQVDAWNAKYPNLPVRFSTVTAVAAGIDALRAFSAAVAAGKAPTVMDFDRFQVAAYANWRLIKPIDEYVKQGKLNMADYSPAAMGEATGLDKRLYGLPSNVDVRLLYWNKRQFAEAGLDPDRPPASWEELQGAAARLTRRGARGLERVGFNTEYGQSGLHIFAWQNGGGFQSTDGKSVTLAAAPNQQALEWMAGLMAAQAEWPEAKAAQDSWGANERHPFLTGQLAMQYEINGFADTMARFQPQMAFGVAPPPPKQPGGASLSWSGGYSYVMGKSAKDADVAWEFMRWLVGEEACTVAYDSEATRAKAVGGVFLPGMTGQASLDTKLFAKYKTGLPMVDAVTNTAIAQMQHTRYREPSIAAADLWEGVTKAQRDTISHLKSAKDALEEQNARVQRALDQAWVFAPK